MYLVVTIGVTVLNVVVVLTIVLNVVVVLTKESHMISSSNGPCI